MRINDIEFRQLTGPNLLGVDRPPEIVCWNDSDTLAGEYCYTLLWFMKDSEGYYVKFVGDRPFKYHNRERLWWLMEYAQSVLDAKWKLLNATAMDNQ